MSVCSRHSAHGRRFIPAASVIATTRFLAASVIAALVAAILSCGSGAAPTNVAPMPSCASGDSPPNVAQGLLLTTILGDGARGHPLTSTIPYAPGAVVPYCYAPSAGYASAVAVSRGAAVKDSWKYGLTNPSNNAGCSGDMHAAFLNTLQRLRKLGVDQVDIYQNASLVDVNAASLDFDLTRRLEISDPELAWIVGAATAAGLAVHEYMQIDGDDLNGVPLPTPPTPEWASAYLDAYTRFIVGRAAVAQSDGIQAFQLDWGAYWFDWTPLRDLFITKMTAAARQVRGVYSGKILYGAVDPWISNDPDLMNSIDWFIGNIFGINFSAADNENITVPQLKQKYLDLITALGNALGPTKRPVVWQIYAQSHRDFLLNGWVEDGFCVSSCAQNAVRTDFSVQAIAYEAMLEAVSTQTAFTTAGVTARASWYVDVMLPAQSFPNISQSWRNKPAESILYRWFARPAGSALIRARERVN